VDLAGLPSGDDAVEPLIRRIGLDEGFWLAGAQKNAGGLL